MAKDILQYQLPKLNPQIRTAPNVEYELKGLPLDGKLVTSTNPLLIGKNFRTMTNMRYEDNHPSSIMGMTKINTSALDTYRKVRSAYHFEKSFHAESHLLMQAYNTGLTASGVACLSNTIPNTGNVNEVMYLDVAPATAWAIGDTITGATSLKTCTIIKKLSTTSYVVTGRSGTYTDGEVLTNGSVTANQGAGYPTFTQVSMWTDSSGAGTGMFAGISNGQVVYANGVDVCIWGGFEQRCAAIISSTATLTDSDSTPTNPQDLTVALGNDLETEGNIFTVSKVSPYLLIGTTRPAEGFKFYLETVNSTASTATVKTFNGASWVRLTATDFTSANGVTLAQDGSIIFDSTVGVSKQKYIEGYYLFWYLVSLSAGTATISHITADLPFQNIIDVWDGNFRDIAAAYKVVGAAVTDITLNVSNYSSYIESDTGSYADLNLLASTSYLEVGFTSKQTALYVAVPDNYTNSGAATVSVYAWDGFSYKSVSSVLDGTLSDGKSLARSGVIAWTNADIDAEQKKTVAGSFPLYFYKIQWSAALWAFSGSVRIYYIGGIPTSNDITHYSFGIMAADRLMLGCNNSYSKNSLIISAQDRPEVFNGTDTQAITFGRDDALMCGAHVFAQYSSNIYNIVLMFKAKETWILQWNQSSSGVSWSRFCISPNIGCPAPRTLCTASVIFEKNLMQAKSVAIWRAHDGIYISNGQSPLKVSEDIKDVFDPNSTTKVNTSMVANEYSFIDEHRLEYHWCWASGSSTTLDKEYVLDLNTWQWFTIDRGSGKYLQCGVKVADTYGTKYTYGFIDTGYIERLEYGTTLDGSDITSTLQFGEMIPIEGNLMAYTMLEMANLICIKKATNSTVTMTVYLDGLTSGTDYTFTISDSTHAYANVMKDIFSAPAIFYGIKLVHVSNAETKGFEPLALTFYYQKKRAHTR